MDTESDIAAGSEILLLEDDVAFRRRLAAHLRGLGAVVTECPTLENARHALAALSFDFALVDLHLPDGEALDLLRTGAFSENTGVVVMTAFGGVRNAVEAIRLGAGDYLTKPFEPEELSIAFLRCREERGAARRNEAGSADGFRDIPDELFFGQSLSGIRAQLELILAADRRLERELPPLLIEGETGSGKSVLARWIHRHGLRSSRALVKVDCAALPDSLAESELFGHERGAFTDAKTARIGLFEAADGGTLLLDDIATLSIGIQAKVLSAVEERTIRRLGGTRETRIDVRLITTSNESLATLVEKGLFREDLYHRLDLLHVRLPPLRERGRDILNLARYLLERIAKRHRRKGMSISAAGEARLLSQAWNGNARELAHEIERATIFEKGPQLDFTGLGEPPSAGPPSWRNPKWRIPDEGFSVDRVVGDLITEALAESRNNVSAAARRLGVTREFLRYRLACRKAGA